MELKLFLPTLSVGILLLILETGVVTTQRPPIGGVDTRRRTTTIIRLDGSSYVKFNFERLPSEYLRRTEEEEFSFWFLTDKPDGLIWFHEEPRRNLYIAMKDGQLVFVNDDKNGRPEQVYIGRRSNTRFDDYRWHRLKIRRNGRRVRLTVDDDHQEEYIFSDDVQFLTAAEVWLGGTPNTFDRTSGNVRTNFDGGVAEVIYITTNREASRIIRNEVNLITQLSQGSATGDVSVLTIPDPFQPGGGTFVPIPPPDPQ